MEEQVSFRQLVERWNELPADPKAIHDFCRAIPPELEPMFIVWLMDLKREIERTVANRDPTMVN